jgi:hypothetical protein
MQTWNTARATIYGVAIGLAAAAVKLVAPWSEPHVSAVAVIRELVGRRARVRAPLRGGGRFAQFRRAAANLAAIRSRLAQQLWQLGEVWRNPPRLHALEKG